MPGIQKQNFAAFEAKNISTLLDKIMKKSALVVLIPLTLMLASCSLFTFAPQIGMKEKKWLRNTVASDLVYIEGNVKAYRAAGSYYYFKDGKLAKVTQSMLPAEKI